MENIEAKKEVNKNPIQTVVFPVKMKDGQILEVFTGRKTRKIGESLRNGFGGNTEPQDASIFHTACRELQEETGGKADKTKGLICWPSDLKPVAVIDFRLVPMDISPKVYFFVVENEKLTGKAEETSEMIDFNWFPVDQIPYNEFMPADQLFLPKIFAGQCIIGDALLDKDPSAGADSKKLMVAKSNFTVVHGISISAIPGL